MTENAHTCESPGSAGVRLRGHHFICLQFFRGEGYSARFVDNLERVVNRWKEEPALLVEGADEVCSACPGRAGDGTCLDPNAGETEARRLDRLAASVLSTRPGERLGFSEARERLGADAMAAGRWRFEACGGCTWEDVCEPGWGKLLGAAEKEARQATPAKE